MGFWHLFLWFIRIFCIGALRFCHWKTLRQSGILTYGILKEHLQLLNNFQFIQWLRPSNCAFRMRCDITLVLYSLLHCSTVPYCLYYWVHKTIKLVWFISYHKVEFIISYNTTLWGRRICSCTLTVWWCLKHFSVTGGSMFGFFYSTVSFWLHF